MLEYFKFITQIFTYLFYKNYLYFFICVVGLCLLTKTAKYIGLIDNPTERSSHTKPTPSGGGLVLVLIILISNINLVKVCPEFFFGGLLIAGISFIDDIKPVPARYRLIIQILVVGAMVIFLPLQNPIRFIPIVVFKIIIFFSGVWFINIYNFMDGIDGLAGGYATAAAIGFLYCIQNTIIVENWNINIYLQLIYVTLPFLVFNWYPAKIFMGDTGSTFIGFAFFCLGARALIFGNNIMYSFAIIMSFFWIDATMTLLRRFFNGKKILQPHKEHAFHKATRLFGHWKVSSFMILVTMFWLTPMAKLAVTYKEWDNTLAIISVLPVFGIIMVFKPGLPFETQGRALRLLTNWFKCNNT
jgi:Fuc2NAc and GlcNAc transferase